MITFFFLYINVFFVQAQTTKSVFMLWKVSINSHDNTIAENAEFDDSKTKFNGSIIQLVELSIKF